MKKSLLALLSFLFALNQAEGVDTIECPPDVKYQAIFQQLTDSQGLAVYDFFGHVVRDVGDNIHYPNTVAVRNALGEIFYSTGQRLLSSDGRMYFPNGKVLRDEREQYFHANGQIARDTFGRLFTSSGELQTYSVASEYRADSFYLWLRVWGEGSTMTVKELLPRETPRPELYGSAVYLSDDRGMLGANFSFGTAGLKGHPSSHIFVLNYDLLSGQTTRCEIVPDPG